MALLVIINLLFIIEWLYLFIKTFNIRNAKVQLLLQILASLILERHEFEDVHESDTSQNSEQIENIDSEIDMNNSKSSKKYNSQLEDKFSKHSMKFLILLIKLLLILPLFRLVS